MAKAKNKKDGITLDYFVAEVISGTAMGKCTQLCDVTELEHVCGQIREAFAASRDGYPEDVSSGLETILRSPLVELARELRDSGGIRVEFDATIELIDQIDCTVCALKNGPWLEADAEQTAQAMRFAWYKWIAYLSSYYMWAKVPRMLGRPKLNKRNSDQPAKDGKPGRVRKNDHDKVLAKYDELLPINGRNTASIVARIFNYEPKTVRAMVRKRESNKSEPNPTA